MAHFVAFSFQPGASASAELALSITRARRAMAMLIGPDSPIIELVAPTAVALLARQYEGDVSLRGTSACAIRNAHSHSVVTWERCTADALLHDALTGCETRWRSLAPPFGGLVSVDGERWCAHTDDIGLQCIYVCETREWCALSSSALVAAGAAGATLDPTSVLLRARLGWLLGRRTLFSGVTKLHAGESACIMQGTVTREVRQQIPDAHDAPPDAEGLWTKELAAVLCDSVGGCLTVARNAGLELSGGIDSRAILAAVPARQRVRLDACTIVSTENADGTIAAGIAKRCGLTHHLVDLDSVIAEASRVDLGRELRTIAIASDCTRHPLFGYIFDRVNSKFPKAPRLTGQGGEIARGFYYPGQPDVSKPTAALIRRLVSWRLTVNESCQPSLFCADGQASAERCVHAEVGEFLMAAQGSWLRRLDALYLLGRMQHAIGAGISAATERFILAPFFHPRYISLARRAPTSILRNGRGLNAAICALDPGLGDYPLASGRTPRILARRGPRAWVGQSGHFARKAARRVWEKIRGTGRPGIGVTGIADATMRQEHAFSVIAAGALRTGLFDTRMVEQMWGRGGLSANSIGLLAAISAASEFLRELSERR